MKRKILSVILIAAILISSLSLMTTVSAESGADIPIVYVLGQGAELGIPLPGGGVNQIYPVNIPEGYIEGIASENADLFAKAVATQKWDDFCDLLYESVTPLYKDLILNEYGEVTNGSVCIAKFVSGRAVNGKYDANQFVFEYDFRLDPLVTADKLHSYIEHVINKTGAPSVALVGRCLGASIVTAYMYKYNNQYVSDLILYASALNGATQCSKAFCGELYLDSDGIERFLYDTELTADESTDEIIKSLVTIFNNTAGLDLAAWSVNNVYNNIYLNIVPRILRETYGTFPGYWAMVSEEDYDKAKETVFFGADAERWAPFIKVIDNYHYNIQCRYDEILNNAIKAGVDVFNICKYGKQTIPVTNNANVLSDGMVSLDQCSMGATVKTVNTKFSRSYIKNAEKNGTAAYIAPDKQVDASTAFLRDRTWFVKNLAHKDFPDCINDLIYYLIDTEDVDINTSEKYPQFLVYNDATMKLDPMTAENSNTTSRWNVSTVKAFFRLLSTTLRLLWIRIKEDIFKIAPALVK